jgi:hypothetical protein
MMDHVIEMEQKGIPVFSHYRNGRRGPVGDVQTRPQAQRGTPCRSQRLPGGPFLRDGRSAGTPQTVTQNDIDLWTDFVKGCSPRSLWMRFLSPLTPRLRPPALLCLRP